MPTDIPSPMTTITIQLEGSVEKTINDLAKKEGKTPEQIVLDLLGREDFHDFIDHWRSYFVPLAENAGIQADKDVDRVVEEMRRKKESR